ncbi:MAG: site-specific DNA-methyltransferase [Lentisphaerae bacterium]|nr:site-specific DNA-methyltransferase [Lentisphaerota bacterium]
MRLDYEGKIPEVEFLARHAESLPTTTFLPANKLLLQGDNLEVMRFLLENGYAGKIDLVYIDPPFATNNIFTIGEKRVSTISCSKRDKTAYSDNLTGISFIEFIRQRLILLRELMSERGSIYLHIDYKIGHYVKIIMDEVFGENNFRNDITRIKCNPKNFSRSAYGNIKDLILFYSKGKNPIWNDPRQELEDSEVSIRFNKINSQGRRYTTVPLHAPGETLNGPTGAMWRGMLPPEGRHWRSVPEELERLDSEGLIEWSKTGNPRRIIFADERKSQGKKMQDVWTFKDSQYPQYPTEKNLDLLECIVKASSTQESVILDCFCGSGTTLVAAEKAGRKWIGIDQSEEAIRVSDLRLSNQMDIFAERYSKYEFVRK